MGKGPGAAISRANGRKGGRPKGVTNAEKAVLHELIRPKAQKIFDELWKLALHAKDDAIRLGALKEICDRGFGKPFQAVGVDVNESKEVRWIVSWSKDEIPIPDPVAGLPPSS
jgi:hypothetical protein